MRFWLPLLAIAACAMGLDGQDSAVTPPSASIQQESMLANLPLQKIGRDDLLGISVYDAPELTRTARVGTDGLIRLPMLKQPITAAGLFPSELEKKISESLVSEGLLVDPIVTVSIAEYRSRPITVVGAVKQPLTFQAMGSVTLLDAISRAGGLSDTAGSDILVNHSQIGPDGTVISVPRRIPIARLIDGADPELNLRLEGGEEIRVPEQGEVYVVGNVKTPGMYPIKEGGQSSVLKLLAVSGGVLPYSENLAYIYRTEGGPGGKASIPVDLKKIIDRKAPDVAVLPHDILYIPENTGHRVRMTALDKSVMIGAGLVGALLLVLH